MSNPACWPNHMQIWEDGGEEGRLQKGKSFSWAPHCPSKPSLVLALKRWSYEFTFWPHLFRSTNSNQMLVTVSSEQRPKGNCHPLPSRCKVLNTTRNQTRAKYLMYYLLYFSPLDTEQLNHLVTSVFPGPRLATDMKVFLFKEGREF